MDIRATTILSSTTIANPCSPPSLPRRTLYSSLRSGGYTPCSSLPFPLFPTQPHKRHTHPCHLQEHSLTSSTSPQWAPSSRMSITSKPRAALFWGYRSVRRGRCG